jgi:hypothetical protein
VVVQFMLHQLPLLISLLLFSPGHLEVILLVQYVFKVLGDVLMITVVPGKVVVEPMV